MVIHLRNQFTIKYLGQKVHENKKGRKIIYLLAQAEIIYD